MSSVQTILPGPGAYVLPTGSNGELNDLVLRRFLQTLVASVTGIPGKFVFPRWQEDPPNQPDRDVDWAAVGCIRREREVFAYAKHKTAPDNFLDATNTIIRNQILEVLCSFYGPNAEANSEQFAMGLAEEQNRYQMQVNGFALVEVQESLTVPALVKEKWLMGIDVGFRLRRQQVYIYPSPNLQSVEWSLADELDTFDLEMKPGYGQLPFGIGPFNL